MELVSPYIMTPEEVKHMQDVYDSAKKVINTTFEELRKLSFEYDQFLIVKNYDECEKIMGKMATMSVALNSWNVIKNDLDDYENPYHAISTATCHIWEQMQPQDFKNETK